MRLHEIDGVAVLAVSFLVLRYLLAKKPGLVPPQYLAVHFGDKFRVESLVTGEEARLEQRGFYFHILVG